MIFRLQKFAYGVPWNLFLITIGAIIFSVGLKAIVLPKGFITGGASGLSLLIFYYTQSLTPGIWNIIINIPIFLVGWIFISRRFFFYSIYGMVTFSLFIDLIFFEISIHNPLLSVLAGGTLMGAGAGIILRSLGSAGGNDILAVILNQKYNIKMGSFYFIFNLVLFSFSLKVIKLELMLYSLALSFVTSQVLDYFQNMFNQRKMALIISTEPDAIAENIQKKLRRGATFLDGTGAYSGQRKKIILTVVNNLQLKRLEEVVFMQDPTAFLITENTFNVLGKGFSHRKVY